MEIRIVTLPSGKDPDEIIREDMELWKKAVDESLPVVKYLFKVVAVKYDLSKTKGRSVAAQELIPIINDESDGIRRDAYFKEASELLGVSETTLKAMASSAKSAKAKVRPQQPATKSKSDKLEERCLCLLLLNPNLRNKCADLSEQYFSHIDNRHIYEKWLINPELVDDEVDPIVQDHLESLLSVILPPAMEHVREKELNVCVRRLKERYDKKQQEEVCERWDEGYIEAEEGKQEVTKVDESLKKGFNQDRKKKVV
jgi:DNA primase